MGTLIIWGVVVLDGMTVNVAGVMIIIRAINLQSVVSGLE
jgi:hypothetical protein